MRTFVIGNENAVLGFSLVGVDGRVIHNAAEVNQALDNCLEDKTVGLILVTADAADLARERIDELKVTSLTPLVVEVPGEKAGWTYPSLKEFVQGAVGIRLGGY
ncbi:MAG: Vacuolar H+transporting two-sector ATPase F subunit [Chloroflexi bacterium]|jgi:V/A-type H+-transporting ATPase subunit F|nr:Vacuolar H+transporting two-sector ATPase F subunit [Chloroflexota bacterium]